MSSPNNPEKKETSGDREVDTSRRDFLKVAMTLSAIMAFGGIGTVLKSISNPAPPGTRILTFPRVKVAELSSLAVGSPIFFNYPLDSEPNFLVQIGQKAVGGVGPNQDIVAFSQICQHWGCESISYQAQSQYGPVAVCSCHKSTFAMLESAAVKYGPSLLPLPQVVLEVDSSGNIYAKGMGPPAIYNHSGSDYVSADLSNGNPVG